MKIGTFYLLPQEKKQENNTFNHTEYLVSHITTTQWRSGKTILITCENKLQAQKIDALLWKFNSNTFLPHHLCTNDTYNTPIIIYWPQCYYNNNKKNILINLMLKNMNFFCNFNEIIDFVPFSKHLKQYARNRYQSYKRIGFQLRTITYTP